jgi:hypothetical protein
MRNWRTLLLILALPAGAIGYTVGAAVTSAMPLPDNLRNVVALFAPLLLAGLCMVPFIIPFFDQMAKRDLAAIRERGEPGRPGEPGVPGGAGGSGGSGTSAAPGEERPRPER